MNDAEYQRDRRAKDIAYLESGRAYSREYQRAKRAANKTSVNTAKRIRYANSEKEQTNSKRRAKAFAATNPEKTKAYRRRYQDNDPLYPLKHRLKERIRQAVKLSKKSDKTMRLVGCSLDRLRAHLESLFRPGMTWDNMGAWHIDHKLPLASFDLTKSEEQYRAFNYTNLQPLWALENLQKGDRNS